MIEAVRRTTFWPWHSLKAGEELIARLAEFHTAAAGAAAFVPEWQYEAELQAIALQTRTAVEQCRSDPDLAALARNLSALNRVVAAPCQNVHSALSPFMAISTPGTSS